MEFIIAESNKQLFIQTVIEILQEENTLPNISENFSAEGGFELPWTLEWLKRDFNNKDLALKYHSSRQLRIISDGNIIKGLRFKDDCNYWSEEEISILQDVINRVVKEL